ncbi:restriction endonuclease subunit S [Acidithiobacillus sp.]|uniref:restriction endonuclease subunit S n=1 Tax=Acidithiobacillus sp. TaxID=1872118 RepID=UPI00260CBE9B|nr:restriction endonuclease subunit S [Acidithiobacillus sp.]MDD5279040.1 restriction endonuclease subunit S [Acidithiobacillus sp.]
MASEWQKLALGDLTEWSSGGTPPKSNPEFWGGDIPWISASSMKTGRLSESDRTLTPEGLKRGSRLARKGNVLLLVRGSELHKRIPVGIAVRDVSFNQDVKALCAKNGLDKDFLYHWLAGNETMLLSKVENTGIGAGKLDTNVLKNLPVLLPPRPEQRRIAHILGTLDDKIENNRKTAKTLEAMAQAIFQSWFVDFDPIRAKIAGESPESICKRLKLTPEILDLFPDRLVDSELGEIPEGWEVKPLGDLLELAYGKPLKAENRTNGNIPVYGSNGLIGWHDEKLIDGPGIVVGRKGNPGTVTWVESGFYPIDTTFYVIPINRVGLRFLYHALMRHDLTSLGADSAVPGLNRNLAYISKQLVPHDSLDSVFENLTEKLFLSIHNLNKQTMDGTEIRDTLLPKLISGEIRVPEVEHIIKNIEG